MSNLFFMFWKSTYIFVLWFVLCIRKNTIFIAFTEEDVNVEQPSSDPQGCLLQNCTHIINNQPQSSNGYAVYTKSPTRQMGKSDGTAGFPIHATDTVFNSPGHFPESVSVHSQFYDKCQRNSDEYMRMEMSVTLSNHPNHILNSNVTWYDMYQTSLHIWIHSINWWITFSKDRFIYSVWNI